MDVSPDGRMVLFRPRAARNELWTVALDGSKPIRITDTAVRPMGSGAFSPDGARILYSGEQDVGGKLRRVWTVVPAGGGEAVATIDSPPESKDVEWSLDGKSLTFLRSANGATNIYRQRLDGGESQQVTRFTDGEIFDHEISPDGQLFLVIRRTDTDNLWTLAADGSHPLKLTHFDAGQFSGIEWMPPDGSRALFAHGSDTSDVVLIKRATN
jgi:Tol biopolymer transport system component